MGTEGAWAFSRAGRESRSGVRVDDDMSARARDRATLAIDIEPTQERSYSEADTESGDYMRCAFVFVIDQIDQNSISTAGGA